MLTQTAMDRPGRHEVVDYYFTYIDKVPGTDALSVLESQLESVPATLGAVSEERSLFRYAPEKWSMREVLAHLNDTERVFAYRAFWFARGFDSPLPSFDENLCAAAAEADRVSWAEHIEEFRAIRRSTIALFRGLPEQAWMRTGTASGNPFTVRALAFIAAGHVAHHMQVLGERYY